MILGNLKEDNESETKREVKINLGKEKLKETLAEKISEEEPMEENEFQFDRKELSTFIYEMKNFKI